MTQLGFDTFTRANQSGWGTATDGNTWSVQSGAATLSIASNEGKATGVTALTYIQIGSATSADAEIIVRTDVSSTNYTAAGICLRGTGTTTFYRFRLNSNTSAQGVGIVKTISGTTTNLVTGSFTVSTSTFYWIRAKAVGTNLFMKAWADGSAEPAAWSLTTTDSSITAAGNIGICVNTTTSGDIANFDNFYAVDYMQLDTVSTTDTSTTSDEFIPTDSLTETETSTTTDVFVPTDSLTQTDVSTTTDVFTPTDNLTTTDTNSVADIFVPVESLTETEVYAVIGAYSASDSLTSADSGVDTLAYSVVENSSLTDTSTTTGNAKNTDSLAVSDSEITTEIFVPIDSITELELVLLALAVTITETSTTSDLIGGGSTFTPSDSLVSSDIAQYLLALSTSDSSNTTDSITFSTFFLANLIDITLNNLETLFLGLTLAVTDTNTSTEVDQLSLAFSQTEQNTLSEASSTTETLNWTEQLTETEQNSLALALSLIEILNVTDSNTMIQVFLPVDQINESELVTYIGIFTSIDSLSILESLSIFLSTIANLVDVTLITTEAALYGLSESLTEAVFGYFDTLIVTGIALSTDSVSTNEIDAFMLAFVPIDSVTHQDTFISALSYSQTDQITEIETVFTSLFYAISEANLTGETFAWVILLFSSESLSVNETSAISDSFSLSDQIFPSSDTIFSQFWFAGQDVLTEIETPLLILSNAYFDQVNLSDVVSNTVSLSITDILSNTESVTYNGQTLLTDSVTTLLELLSLIFLYQTTDQTINSDFIFAQTLLTFTDNVAIVENSAWQGLFQGVEGVTSMETLAMLLIQNILETLSEQETGIFTSAFFVTDPALASAEIFNITAGFVPVDLLLSQELFLSALALSVTDALTILERAPSLGYAFFDIPLSVVDALTYRNKVFILVYAKIRTGAINVKSRIAEKL